MTDPQPRQYLDDVSPELQDLLYDKKVGQAINLLMKENHLGKMEAAMQAGQTLKRMQAAFPDAIPEMETGLGAGLPKKTKARIMWSVVCVITLAGAIMTFFGARGLMLANQSKSWPSVTGKIVASSVEKSRGTDSKGRSSTSYHARIKYEFTVDAQAFTGKRVAFGDHGGDSSHANKMVKRFPKGKKVPVFYQPANPKKCLLEPGVKGQAFILPSIGLIFLLIGIVFVCAAISVTKDERKAAGKTSPADGFKTGPLQ